MGRPARRTPSASPHTTPTSSCCGCRSIGPSATWLYRRLGKRRRTPPPRRPHRARRARRVDRPRPGHQADVTNPTIPAPRRLLRARQLGPTPRRPHRRATAVPPANRPTRPQPPSRAPLTHRHPPTGPRDDRTGDPAGSRPQSRVKGPSGQAPNTVTPVADGGLIGGENQAVEHAAGPAVTGRAGTVGEATIHSDHLEQAT